MTSPNFTAAQEHVIARRQSIINAARERHESQPTIADLSRPLRPIARLGRRSLYLWDILKGREGTFPAFRVGQVDAELLDEELLDLLRAQVGEALKYFGVRSTQLHKTKFRFRLTDA